jgi:hypothetical protein
MQANKRFLGVFSKGVAAFCASHELRHGFVSATCLNHPDKDFVVAAFFAYLFDA